MKSGNISPRTAFARNVGLAVLPLVTSLAGCSGDTVTMGEDGHGVDPTTLPADALCRESTTHVGDVTAESQEEIGLLEGCQAIQGNVSIRAFAGVDLRPLHALETVTGSLQLWAPTRPEDTSSVTPLFESLEGLESLESVGSLRLHGLIADNVAPLQKLQVLTAGYLTITGSPNLTSLGGLAQLAGVSALDLDCASLEDIAPLRLPEAMISLDLRGSFSQLSPLGVTLVSESFSIVDTELSDLEAFSALGAVLAPVWIVGNPLLENIDALHRLSSLDDLIVRNNPNLTHLPKFEVLAEIGNITIVSNDRLTEVPPFGRNEQPFTDIDPLALLDRSSARAVITDNPALTAITLPQSWLGGSALVIDNNPLLAQVRLTEQRSYDYLSITGNASLTSLDIGVLGTVDVLEVASNPQLDTSVFDAVQTFEVRMSDNAAAP